jgi:hypothetical protein
MSFRRRFAQTASLLFTSTIGLLTSCGHTPSDPGEAAVITGSLHGGQQPISGSNVQLYAVGAGGDGTAATPLGTPAVTDGNGGFTLSGYSCASPTSLLYIVASGGDPAPGMSNPQAALMAAIGPCNTLTTSSFLNINEITTVAAVYALAPYMTGPANVASGSSDSEALTTAFTTASEVANVNTGTTPGANLPNGVTVPTNQVNTLADILANCINSPGGVASDGSACGTYLGLTTPPGITPPTDAISALVNLALNPTLNTQLLYASAIPASPYQPVDPTQPPDLSLPIAYNNAIVVSPIGGLNFPSTAVGTSSPAQTITVSNPNTTSINLYAEGFTGPNFSQVSSSCSNPIAAHSACSIVVAFTPKTIGALTTTFTLSTSAANPTVSLTFTGLSPQLTASPTSISFPATIVYTPLSVANQLGVTLTNNSSTSSVTFSSIAVTGTNAGDFPLKLTCGTVLGPGAVCYAITNFVPTAPGNRSATLVVTSTGTSTPLLIPLLGVGIASTSTLSASPTGLSFASIVVGQTSPQQNIYLTNSGPDPVQVTAVNVTGANPADFTVNPSNCTGGTLPANSDCFLGVVFNPTAGGTRNTIISVTSSAVDPTINIPVSATGYPAGTSLTLSPTGLSVFSAADGDTSAQQSVQVTNATGSPVTVSSITFTGTNAGDFHLGSSTNCPTTIAASATCAISVVFKPTAPGYRAASLAVASSAANSPSTVLLTGQSTADLNVSASSLSFPSTQVYAIASSATQQTFTIQNLSADTIRFTSFAFTGANPADFSQTNTCASGLSPLSTNGSICTVTVDFLPTGTGNRSATFIATSNTYDPPFSVAVSGVAVPSTVLMGVTPSITFPGTTIGQTATSTGSVGIATNPGQAVVSGLSLSGANPGDFAITNSSCIGLLLAYAGANTPCSIGVSFTPTATGTRSATVVVTSSAANSPLSIALTGTGVTAPPVLTVAPTSINFATTAVGTADGYQSIVVTNNGPGVITFGSSTLAGSGAGAFPVSNGCTGMLAVNASCTVSVAFNPSAVGSYSASFNLASNASVPTITVSLSGTGVGAIGALTAQTYYGSTLYLSSPAYQFYETSQSGQFAYVNLTNTGTAAISVGSFSLPAGYTDTTTCGASLAPNTTCAIYVTPNAYPQVPVLGTLTINSNAINPVVNVPMVTALYPIVDFGSSLVGMPGGSHSFVGNSSPNVSSFSGTISGSNAADFSPNPSCVNDPYVGVPCTTPPVYFTPSGAGLRVAYLTATVAYAYSTEYYTFIGTGN